MPEKIVYSQAQKNMIWASLTKKHIQKLPSVAIDESNTYSFDIPKSRYLSKVGVLIEGTFKLIHASETTATLKRFAPYEWLTGIKVDINNGFSPFKTNGKGLYLFNLLNPNTYNMKSVISNDLTPSRTTEVCSVAATSSASSSGVTNTLKMYLELPLTINDRDPVGMINTQDQSTNVNVTMDFGNLVSSLLGTTTGFTSGTHSFTCTPFVESFTIPANPISQNPLEPLLDLQTLKLVQSESKTVSATGEETLKLPIGTTYRRIIFDIHSSNTGLTDAQVTNFMIAQNQADKPLNITGKQLQAINQNNYGWVLPDGIWVFDFTYQGSPNYGGSRDYIDTQNLNEFWAMIQMGTTGTINYHYESLVRLGG